MSLVSGEITRSWSRKRMIGRASSRLIDQPKDDEDYGDHDDKGDGEVQHARLYRNSWTAAFNAMLDRL